MRIEPGQVAVVTGAGQGLGRAIATELAGRGVSVVLADLREDSVRSAADELADAGDGTITAAVVDVSDADAVASLAQRVVDQFGRVDLVVNNAGIVPTDGKPLWEADLARGGGSWT